jgi:transglutaminase-like putative cysteine protease
VEKLMDRGQRRLRVIHETTYTYDAPIKLSHSVLHLRPRSTDNQTVLRATLEVLPGPDTLQDHVDAFGNTATWLSVERPHDRLQCRSELEVELRSPNGLDALTGVSASSAAKAAATSTDPMVRWCRFPSPLVSHPNDLRGVPLVDPAAPLAEQLHHLLDWFHQEWVFDATATTVSSHLTDVLAGRAGVCQDFAHVALLLLRRCGIAARYVSGYLETTPPPGSPRLVGADASHAWVAVFTGSEWVDLDPTNACFVGTSHVTVAVGRDYGDVAPTRGVTIGPPHVETLHTSVDTVAL